MLMDYYRTGYAQLPVRAMGSPDGLGAPVVHELTPAQRVNAMIRAMRRMQPRAGSGNSGPRLSSQAMAPRQTKGLGAYYQTAWTQGIAPDPGGTNTIAQYHPIVKEATNGLGCGCGAPAAGLGDLSSVLQSPWLKVLGVGMIGVGVFLLRDRIWPKHAKNGRRRHRRNSRWSGKKKRSLPDSSFLYVEPGGQSVIENGKRVTIPRSLRHFPYKDAAGNVSLPHLRNAIARIPQSNLSQSTKTVLQAKARSILAAHGGYSRAAA